MASTPVSPKVHAAGGTSAVVVVLMWLLDKIPAIATMPGYVHVAVLAIVVGVVTWLAGFQIPDRLRELGAKFDNSPTTAPTKNQAGAVDLLTLALVVLIVVVILVLLGVVPR